MSIVVPLEAERLAGLRWTFPTQYHFARSRTSVPLIASEILRAAHEFPIGFSLAAGQWRPVAILRDRSSGAANAIDDAGRWTRTYVPFWLRVHPFVVRDESIELELDPRCVGSTGHFGFVKPDGTLTGDVRSTERQLQMASSGRNALAAAATLLASELGEPWRDDGQETDLRIISQAGLRQHVAPRLSEWLARGHRVVELAVAAAFSVTTPASNRRAPEPRPPAPPFVPARAATLPAARIAAQASVPADLDWLDLGDKITF